VAVLLESGVEVDKARDDGCTPLIIAAAKGNEALVVALLKAGADVTRAMEDRSTAISVATQNGHESVVATLTRCMTNE